MSKPILFTFCLILLLTGSFANALAQSPAYVSYQGTLYSGGMAYTGPAEFKFVIVDGEGTSVWSNDGTSTTGDEPSASVTLLVADGIFSVLLGHPDPGMVPLFPEFLHDAPMPLLRIWVDTGGGFEQMTDVWLASAPYALEADVARRALGGFFVDGELHTLSGIRFPDDTVQSTAATGTGADTDWTVSGSHMYSGVSGYVGIGETSPAYKLHVAGDLGSGQMNLLGSAGRMAILYEDGANSATLELAGSGGTLGDVGLTLDGGGPYGGGQMVLYNGAGSASVEIDGDDNSGGGLVLLGNGTTATVYMDGKGNLDGGQLQLTNNTGTITYRVRGHAYGSAAQIETFDQNGLTAHQITASNREMKVYDSLGNEQVRLNGADSGGELLLWQDDGSNYGVVLDGDSGGDGLVRVYDGSGTATVEIVGEDSAGNGRVITEVLQITGGADLSENFDISPRGAEIQPGMTVCIDPSSPGRLAVSDAAYDRKVAGIVSGAGGVRPGMLMGQQGSVADGAHPVALTGRVWTWCDASQGPIEPGDLLTTSPRPGHAMKADDPARASGATLGKAMSSLERGQGLVLVLVNLQ